MKLLVRLRETKINDNLDEVAHELESLVTIEFNLNSYKTQIQDKISALKNAERAVSESPRLLRTDSPRLLRSPRTATSPEPVKGMPTIKDFTIVKTISEGAFGYVKFTLTINSSS
jgi:hypothetical protein